MAGWKRTGRRNAKWWGRLEGTGRLRILTREARKEKRLSRANQKRVWKKEWVGPREWVMIQSWGGVDPGWIPRDILEDMGIDCGPLDQNWGSEMFPQQGTVWFKAEDGEKIRNHPEFLSGEDPWGDE